MSDNNNLLKKIFYTGVGALDLGVEAISDAVDACAKRGEEAVEKSREYRNEFHAKHEETKTNNTYSRMESAFEKMSAEQRENILSKLRDVHSAINEFDAEAEKNINIAKEAAKTAVNDVLDKMEAAGAKASEDVAKEDVAKEDATPDQTSDEHIDPQ